MREFIPIELHEPQWHECTNPGVCCIACPRFDECEQHYDEDQEEGD